MIDALHPFSLPWPAKPCLSLPARLLQAERWLEFLLSRKGRDGPLFIRKWIREAARKVRRVGARQSPARAGLKLSIHSASTSASARQRW